MSTRPVQRSSSLGMVKDAVVRLLTWLLWPVAAVLSRLGVRFLTGGNVLTRIGHMALAPDLYVKTERLGWRPRARGILLAPAGSGVNPCLLGYWSRFMTIVRQPIVVKLLRVLERSACLQHDLGSVRLPGQGYVRIIPAVYTVQSRYEAMGGAPVLQLTTADEARGRRRLRELGVPEGAWFVCLHVRESGYLPDLAYHAYRNSDIRTYLSAVEAIVERGGWVLRMGDRTMTPLPRLRQVVDYVHSGLQTDWMDVFCFARCRVFLGDTSGPFNVAFAFGVPCALANFIPLGHGPYSARDLWIPKRYRATSGGRELSFAEILHSPLRMFGRSEQCLQAGVSWMENTEGEIRGLAVEMLDRLDGRAAYVPEDEERQRRFQALLSHDPRWATTARVGRDFLRQHARLLDEPSRPATAAPATADAQATPVSA